MELSEWSTIYYVTVILATFCGGLIAISKLFFITNKNFGDFKTELNGKFYDAKNSSFFVAKEDCTITRNNCEKQRDEKRDLATLQIAKLQDVIEIIKDEQTKLIVAIEKMTVKVDQVNEK